ncbi:macrophage mannose receptor 1-like [Notolabrus celidotus]|uniref:macrophage mannose receptor 1-like n=1 Tax=Notolabrus celidotus TaxID=1203425 RepID=UPI00148FEA14|nr:macrophage mannose receptor 1-like [Notolabrus celidotus]
MVSGQFSFFSCHLYEYHLIKKKKTWDDAQNYCRDKYTDLATVCDVTDTRRLGDLVTTPAWIGLHSIPGRENRKWHWSLPEMPGVEPDDIRSYFGDREPNDSGSDKNCVEITGNKLNDFKCDKKREFICFNDSAADMSSGELSPHNSPQPNDQEDKVVLVTQELTWEEALNYCREHHRDLVSITNPQQQKWVQARAKNASTDYVWLGLRYTCTMDLWFWVNDYLVCYDNWKTPDDGKDLCDYAAAMEKNGEHKWVKKVDTNEFNFFCI